jgi:hypothetical protein
MAVASGHSIGLIGPAARNLEHFSGKRLSRLRDQLLPAKPGLGAFPQQNTVFLV